MNAASQNVPGWLIWMSGQLVVKRGAGIQAMRPAHGWVTGIRSTRRSTILIPGHRPGGCLGPAAVESTVTMAHRRGGIVPVLIDTVAWICLETGTILCARPRGKDVFYIPGGKRENGESELAALLREINEELTVTLVPATVQHAGTYEACQPGDPSSDLVVRMSCYTGDYSGTLAPSSEIDELAWFTYADRPRVPPVDQLLFDDLHATGQLR